MFEDLVLLGIAFVVYSFFIRWITLYLWHGKRVIASVASRAVDTFKKVKASAPVSKREVIESKIRKIKNWASHRGNVHFSD
ncbi:hypothetical protein [Kosmotoga pacifica]|uniref:Uncharacterized protein n=1 Tax=Kosmotoga pacifica TaxID=1330330 RepID=A0A0G2ZCJ8_9BACT|nr:hypothetical protein [Kosmotoga pacifica]AKI97826.1 hypothetical protein IX53_08390 [Kosmotoga pacifica]